MSVPVGKLNPNPALSPKANSHPQGILLSLFWMKPVFLPASKLLKIVGFLPENISTKLEALAISLICYLGTGMIDSYCFTTDLRLHNCLVFSLNCRWCQLLWQFYEKTGINLAKK